MRAPFIIRPLAMTLMVGGTLSAFAQNGTTGPEQGKMRVEITRNENGNVTKEVHEFNLADSALIGMEHFPMFQGLPDLDGIMNGAFDSALFDLSPLEDISFAFSMPSTVEAFNYGGKGGYLGVQYEDARSEKGAATSGARITVVEKGTPAETAGLRKDDIVQRVGEHAVSNGRDLVKAVKAHAPGTDVSVEYKRGKRTERTKVRLGEHPFAGAISEPRIVFPEEDDIWPVGGEPRGYLGLMGGGPGADAPGVLIGEVVADSPAEDMGLEAGDLIQRINDRPMADLNELSRLVRELGPGAEVRVDFLRDAVPMTAVGVLGEQQDRITSLFHAPPAPGRHGFPDGASFRQEMQQLREDMERLRTELRGSFSGPKHPHAPPPPPPAANTLLERKGVKGLDKPLDVETFQCTRVPGRQAYRIDLQTRSRGDLHLDLHDAAGTRVHHESIPAFSGRYERTLDLGEYPAGTYYLVVGQHGTATAKELVKD